MQSDSTNGSQRNSFLLLSSNRYLFRKEKNFSISLSRLPGMPTFPITIERYFSIMQSNSACTSLVGILETLRF